MARTDLTAQRLRELFRYDQETGVFTRLFHTSNRTKSGCLTGSLAASGYVLLGIDGHNHRAHRLAWLYMTGEWPSREIDHRNRIKSDNRWPNLRLATHKQNGENLPLCKRTTSGVRGVSWNKECQKWFAYLMHNYKTISLGLFVNKQDAIEARISAEQRYFTHTER